MFVHAAQLTWDQFWNIITAPRVLAALKLSFSTALYAALINGLIGTLLAWVLVRYTFPGRKIIDAMIDLPFALPTAVAGIALTALYTPTGLVGQFAADLGFKIAYSPLGITLALTFVTLPFVVRTVQPVLADIPGNRRSRRLPGRQAVAGVPLHPRARVAACLADRLRPGVCPWRR